MKQIWVTDKVKKIIDREHKKQRVKAVKSGGPMPTKASVAEVLILEGLSNEK